MILNTCEKCGNYKISNEHYTVAGYHCPINNYKCDDDHHLHNLCDDCGYVFEKYWTKKHQKLQKQQFKIQKNKNLYYKEQQEMDNWIENKTNIYNQTNYTYIKNKKVSFCFKENYEIEFFNKELSKIIKEERNKWHFANEYNFNTGERPTKYTHPYHCVSCYRPLKYQQTYQIIGIL